MNNIKITLNVFLSSSCHSFSGGNFASNTLSFIGLFSIAISLGVYLDKLLLLCRTYINLFLFVLPKFISSLFLESVLF